MEVSCFHCNNTNPSDARGFAMAPWYKLSNVPGVFSDGQVGFATFYDNQWDEVWNYGSCSIDYWINPQPPTDPHGADFYLGGSIAVTDAVFWHLTFQNSTQIKFMGKTVDISIPFGSYSHIAAIYDSKDLWVYANGVGIPLGAPSSMSIPGPYNCFGNRGIDNYCYSNSYRDEIRISKGVRWTNNFTPPTSPG